MREAAAPLCAEHQQIGFFLIHPGPYRALDTALNDMACDTFSVTRRDFVSAQKFFHFFARFRSHFLCNAFSFEKSGIGDMKDADQVNPSSHDEDVGQG